MELAVEQVKLRPESERIVAKICVEAALRAERQKSTQQRSTA